MNRNLIRLIELEILKELEEDLAGVGVSPDAKREDMGSFYVPKPQVGMYGNMMKGLRGLVWPGGKND